MENIENREIRIKRILNAPIELVWKVWTEPEHIANWWGPNGFTCTIHKMEIQKDGDWELTMHGPDGKDYPNKSIFIEIILHKKIVFEHLNPHFITTILFESIGEKTQMEWIALFDSAEMRDNLIKNVNADEGQKENVDKLEKYLSKELEVE